MATIVDAIDQIAVYTGIEGDFTQHPVEDIATTKTFYATDFLGTVNTAILFVYCSVDIASGDPTITFGKPGSEAALPAPSEIFAKTAFLSPRPNTEETRSYRYDVTSVVDEPWIYNVTGSALAGSNIYFGATLYIVYEYTNDIGPVTIASARTRRITEYSGFVKIT